MVFISVTRLRLRSARFLFPFLWAVLFIRRQLVRAEGNRGFQLRNESQMTFWTLSAWADEAAMKAFMLTGAHRKSMPKLMEWCDEAAVGHWLQETANLPDWKEAHRRMVEEGRMSKVRYPSAAQLAKKIAGPRD
jgi:quinol monooxygenase YgiN